MDIVNHSDKIHKQAAPWVVNPQPLAGSRKWLAGWATANQERFSLCQSSLLQQIFFIDFADVTTQNLVPIGTHSCDTSRVKVLSDYDIEASF